MTTMLRVMNLGRMAYRDALAVQVKLHERLKQSVVSGQKEHPNSLILVEHPAVFTIGIRTGDYPKEEEERLKRLGADFVRTNRGGLITFHGIGQLVAYPIIYLPDFPVLQNSVRCFVHKIEKTVIDLCNDMFDNRISDKKKRAGLRVGTLDDYPGVWINEERKIAAIGVHASKDRVTMHGVALNCNIDLKWYDHIVPCGIKGKSVTSLASELDQDLTVGQTIPHFLQSFSQSFQCDFTSQEET